MYITATSKTHKLNKFAWYSSPGSALGTLALGVHLVLASCLIYARAFKEYISSFGCWSNGYVPFHDVTFREICRRKGARFLYSPWKML